MIVDRSISWWKLLLGTFPQILKLAAWAVFAAGVYEFGGLKQWMTVPWLPISLIGTAVAFYVGFKNNSAYDRTWEARKAWGAIANSSRAWGSAVKSYVSTQFLSDPDCCGDLPLIHRRLLYRHIAWLYALRSQLLIPKPWEHSAQEGSTGRQAERLQREFGVGLIDDEITKSEIHLFLPEAEFERAINAQNTATQLIDMQSMDLQELRRQDLIDDFRHMELQQLLGELYAHQGKVERVKNFPLPRQYASSSSLFITIFMLLLPFGMATEFSKLGDYGVWWSIPFVVLVGWVFATMESIGDFSENPFQGIANDIPMYSLCRGIEIDLREMLGEESLPDPVRAVNGILM